MAVSELTGRRGRCSLVATGVAIAGVVPVWRRADAVALVGASRLAFAAAAVIGSGRDLVFATVVVFCAGRASGAVLAGADFVVLALVTLIGAATTAGFSTTRLPGFRLGAAAARSAGGKAIKVSLSAMSRPNNAARSSPASVFAASGSVRMVGNAVSRSDSSSVSSTGEWQKPGLTMLPSE